MAQCPPHGDSDLHRDLAVLINLAIITYTEAPCKYLPSLRYVRRALGRREGTSKLAEKKPWAEISCFVAVAGLPLLATSDHSAAPIERTPRPPRRLPSSGSGSSVQLARRRWAQAQDRDRRLRAALLPSRQDRKVSVPCLCVFRQWTDLAGCTGPSGDGGGRQGGALRARSGWTARNKTSSRLVSQP